MSTDTPLESLRLALAPAIDYPSVYMGGPSHNSMRKAERILDMLKKEGLI